jgi:hypothetical protein
MGPEEKLPSGLLLSTVEKMGGYARKSSACRPIFGLACCTIEPFHLRRLHHARLPADTALPGHRLGALAGRVDLPRHPQRLRVLPADLSREQ